MAKGRKTGGRKAGVPNKATRDIKAIAQLHGPEIINGFLKLFRSADSDMAKIAAGKEILDRAYGKATQKIADDADEGVPIQVIVLRGVTAGY